MYNQYARNIATLFFQTFLITQNEPEIKSNWTRSLVCEGVSAFLNKALFFKENSCMRLPRDKRINFFIVSNHLMDERNVGKDNGKYTVTLRVVAQPSSTCRTTFVLISPFRVQFALYAPSSEASYWDTLEDQPEIMLGHIRAKYLREERAQVWLS